MIQSVEVTPLTHSLAHTSKASGDNVDSFAGGGDEEAFAAVVSIAFYVNP